MGNQQSLLTEKGYTLLQETENESTGKAALVNKDGNKYIIRTINMTNTDDEIKQRTQREVASLADMDHRHIVRYVESFTDENSSCNIAMDYCEGGDLSEKIKSQKMEGTPFSEDQILDWFVQICLALKHVHDRSIVHRDIKPQCLFLTGEETIKLGDFGVSKILSRKDEYAKTKLGMPIYIAPEVWKDKCFDNKSDIWALGCVLYELCTLEFAFSLQENLLFMFELWNRPTPHLSENFSSELRHLLDELLHKDPAHRPSIDGILRKAFLVDRIPKQLLLMEEVLMVPGPISLEDPGNRDWKNREVPCDRDEDKRSEDGQMYNQEIPMDRNLSNMMFQLNQDIEAFKNFYDQDVGDILSLVKKLEMTADGLERVHFGTTVGSLTGSVVGAAGGITSLVGLILAPFTLGASLIVTGVGIGVAVAGGATSAVSNITNMVNQSMDRKTIEETISEYRDKMEPILMSVEDIITGIHTVQDHESYTNVANMAQAAFRAGRGLGGIAELVRLTQVINVGKVAAQAARAVRVAEAFTGVLSALFIALDVYFIVKDAKEIHSIRQGSQQQDEIKSATMKLVANIREMVSQFMEKLGELECIRAEFKILEI
uniref:non-specific serine/threonine protein kinase n=1 Tax=Paramormyrops kingsleyae TaxID=1676925 RepID=A0A3B3QKY1_9TELE|nr:serine/threonine-protein kinase Nek4-like isoform X1 [Paramormyrops kingsleyae]XP_023695325.1 serine/threonine-protein kinase Nek4-like isoform X1 [Paramormyrops kingsleyae]XP_023695326.1 serine/threonine-protein kinase Nek4-like isoform X1 [Paramormyrops kingsleyae]